LLSEKKLRGVKVGNEAYILLDANGKRYDGVVESILPTSAATFSLVPRDIASGEFTKLDQRFVVRVKLDNIDGLLAGMSAKIVIKRAN
jgi:membrane fusion protein (multidrug efflux system)